MGNSFAYFALFAYPIVGIILFRRYPLPVALIWTILAGYLFLPEKTQFDLPVLPALDKVSIPSFTAAIMCYLASRREARTALHAARQGASDQKAASPRSGEAGTAARPAQEDLFGRPTRVKRRGRIVFNILMVLAVLSPLLFYYGNRSPLVYGPRVVQGISLYDVASFTMQEVIILIPFLLARRYLSAPAAQVALLRALLVGGLVYSVLMLIEIQLSPQLHTWIYGFFQHMFAQHVRGGYRPIVFLAHGLRVGIFICICVLSAVALWRLSKERTSGKYLLAAVWLLIMLVLSRNLGATGIALLFLPVALLFGVRGQLLFAAIIAGTVMTYPVLRGGGVIPVNLISNMATSISPERGASLKIRLTNEELVLAKSEQKPLFGWGGWGRWIVYNKSTGDVDVPMDGKWVILIGERGWVGYLARFGLLGLPLILLAFRRRELGLDQATAGLSLIMAANLLDLIPNSSMVPLTWLVAGALVGRYEYQGDPAEETQVAARRRAMSSTRAPAPALRQIRRSM